MPEMEMNRIEGSGVPAKPPSVEPHQKERGSRAPKQKPKEPGDSIELSEKAKQLIQDSASDSSREARVQSALRRLLSGELLRPEVYEDTAEKLLRSGELDEADA